MDTILIQPTNQKATELLHQLEELHLIKILKKEKKFSKTKLSDKYRGIISKEEGKDLNKHIHKMRQEWSSI